MCIFSGRVNVSNTSIFARRAGSTQYLVYQMVAGADDPVAMILPIPVAQQEDEAIRFIDLSDYANFFEDLIAAFPIIPTLSLAEDGFAAGAIPVHTVGAYQASFVPSPGDFGRLDERFRIDPAVWRQLPDYATYGFAVFQFREAGPLEPHPMAFAFESSLTDAIFFPTVHVHGPTVPESAHFDHDLFCQRAVPPGEPWRGSDQPAGNVPGLANTSRTGGTVDPDRPLFRRTIRGMETNRDTLV